MTMARIGRRRAISAACSAILLLCALAGCARTDKSSLPGPVIEPTANLDAPIDNATVRQCEVFTGTATLPATKTLLLGMRNLDNKDSQRYFGVVDNWEYPRDLGNWHGYVWFGSGNSSVGQRYRVELLIVDYATAEAGAKKAKDVGWHSDKNPEGAIVAGHITVKRVAGPGPAECS